ncbi:MAG: adenylyltransferase/sulfurtransferase MoeZ, partial [Deltaproteobacteria bacterium]|nr:adenylyltransferase/sulfurtransferase MoeZ [Deltaproteobacteria bacterium]
EGDGFGRLSTRDLRDRLDQGWKPYVLDVRRRIEAEIVSFDFTDRVQPLEEILEGVAHLPLDRDIVVCCKVGERSVTAIRALVDLGFDPKRLHNLEGGIVGWARDIDPRLPVY